MDSNNISIGIHFFKVLVQIHYSRSPLGGWLPVVKFTTAGGYCPPNRGYLIELL